MFEFDDEVISERSKIASRQYEKDLTNALLFDDWLKRFTKNATSGDEDLALDIERPSYNLAPEHIKVAGTGKEIYEAFLAIKPKVDEMLKTVPDEAKDTVARFEYGKVIPLSAEFDIKPDDLTIEIGGDKIPIWFNSSKGGIHLRPGFKDKDTGRIDAFKLNDDAVHGMAGGRTGAGKSVLLNSLICTAMVEYAPWELKLHLADFKKVELAKYATPVPCPHAVAVAATDDNNYVVSYFQYILDDMQYLSSALQLVNINNLKGFINEFGIYLPRNLILVDEFIQLFEQSTPEEKKTVNKVISAISRLGRSFGYHMLLSSQSMSGALDDQTAGNFKAGISLPATPSVSKSLIGNEEAVNLKGKGLAYANQDKSAGEADHNSLYWVPFIEDDISKAQKAENAELILAGKYDRLHTSYISQFLAKVKDRADLFGVTTDLKFYQQDVRQDYVKFEEAIDKAKDSIINLTKEDKYTNYMLVMGEASRFSTTNSTEMVKVPSKEEANILVMSSNEVDSAYSVQLLYDNLTRTVSNSKHYTVSGNPAFKDKYMGHFDVTKDFRDNFPDDIIQLELDLRKELQSYHYYLIDNNLEDSLTSVLKMNNVDLTPEQLQFVLNNSHDLISPEQTDIPTDTLKEVNSCIEAYEEYKQHCDDYRYFNLKDLPLMFFWINNPETIPSFKKARGKVDLMREMTSYRMVAIIVSKNPDVLTDVKSVFGIYMDVAKTDRLARIINNDFVAFPDNLAGFFRLSYNFGEMYSVYIKQYRSELFNPQSDDALAKENEITEVFA